VTDSTDHANLRRIYSLASLVGDWPDRPIDPDAWQGWLPEPECERKDNAWRRLDAEGRYEEFCLAKKFYKNLLRRNRVEGTLIDDVFYLALRHFPPGS
jgi:hypothetical protein